MKETVCTNIVFILDHYHVSFYRLCTELRLSQSLSTRIKENSANLTIENITKISNFFGVPPFVFWLSSTIFRYIVVKKPVDIELSIDDVLALIYEFTQDGSLK